MGLCWYCYWGWAKEVAEVYEKHLKALDGDDYPLKFGPSHTVWSDENFDDNNVMFCLGLCDERDSWGYATESDIEVVRQSLLDLIKIPEAVRCCEPPEYDGEHPEKYPPKVEVVRKGR